MQRSAVTTVGEDKSGDCIIISAYNQVDSSLTFNQLQKVFPKEITIGIKNPYMRLWRDGISALRNDNPLNIVFKEDEQYDPLILKDLGNKFFAEKKFDQAIKAYKDALSKTTDDHLKMILFSNTSQSYIDLQMYEDAL